MTKFQQIRFQKLTTKPRSDLLDDCKEAEEVIGRACLGQINNQLDDLQTHFRIRLRIHSTDVW